ncbi:BioY family transporter [Fictibacillus phosphorivorans]|uniref:Biotin transporter n=1 Tax=Fictibacillus phosphorivorans TaxID=1221500 RepID=A0A163Q764_9BACL|nr:biotin transporter BioY [Fictibacillus phosphorivorans]KZE64646.1 BioY family transporter [Fictibacillus phosphorivorans]
MHATNERLKMSLYAALMAGITAILAQLTIPLPLVPITGQTLAIGLCATILGKRYGTMAVALYIAMGAVGLPVFSEAKGGFSVLVGPTGGYIIGFIISAYIMGLILEKTRFTLTPAVIANIIGMVITLVVGAVQLKFAAGLTWDQALSGGVYPFIIVGVIKAVLASVLGITIRRRLLAAKLLSQHDVKAA